MLAWSEHRWQLITLWFASFSRHRSYPVPYLTAAASLGMTHGDVDDFCARLRKCFADVRRRKPVPPPTAGAQAGEQLDNAA